MNREQALAELAKREAANDPFDLQTQIQIERERTKLANIQTEKRQIQVTINYDLALDEENPTHEPYIVVSSITIEANGKNIEPQESREPYRLYWQLTDQIYELLSVSLEATI